MAASTQIAPAVPQDLRLAWEQAARAADASAPPKTGWVKPKLAEQHAILIPRRDEAQQVELLARFPGEGLDRCAPLS